MLVPSTAAPFAAKKQFLFEEVVFLNQKVSVQGNEIGVRRISKLKVCGSHMTMNLILNFGPLETTDFTDCCLTV